VYIKSTDSPPQLFLRLHFFRRILGFRKLTWKALLTTTTTYTYTLGVWLVLGVLGWMVEGRGQEESGLSSALFP
jgi:hypothetical protein